MLLLDETARSVVNTIEERDRVILLEKHKAKMHVPACHVHDAIAA